MQLWLALPFMSVAQMLDVAVAADEAGVTGVALSDHLCVPSSLQSSYPYGKGQPAVLPIDAEFPDPFVTVAALAARTRRLRFTTHVLVLPLRHPLLVAKEVATASVVSDGRVELGVGAGWMREEYDAVGVDFEGRGRMLEEALALLPRLWTGLPVSHDGAYFRLDAVAINPKPRGTVRILVGGHSDAALRRAVTLGVGWVGVNPTIDELAEVVGRLNVLRRDRADATTGDFEIRSGVRGPITDDTVLALERLGVTALVVAPWQINAWNGDGANGSAALGSDLSDLAQLVGAV